MSTVYLAGPITGLSYGESTNWRGYAIDALFDLGIHGISPMRSKDYLLQESIVADRYDDKVLSSAKGITTRDRFDCMRADAVLVNFLGATKVSIGTIMEIAWADMLRKPIVLVMEPDNIHKHAMVETAAGFIVDNLDDGIAVISHVLNF